MATRDAHWRESFFYDIHSPDGTGDALFFTMAHYPARRCSTRCRWVASAACGRSACRAGRTTATRTRSSPAAPGSRSSGRGEEIRLVADPAVCAIGLDLTFTARTQPYGLRRGTMRASDAVVWDQCHILQSGTYTGHVQRRRRRRTRSTAGSASATTRGACATTAAARCGCGSRSSSTTASSASWHWEYANGAPVYTDGCWAGTDGSDPVPVIRFEHDVEWVGADGAPAVYGEHGVHGRRAARLVRVHPRRRPADRGDRRRSLRQPVRAVPPRRAQPDARVAPTTAAPARRSTRSPAPTTTATSPTPPSPRSSPPNVDGHERTAVATTRCRRARRAGRASSTCRRRRSRPTPSAAARSSPGSAAARSARSPPTRRATRTARSSPTPSTSAATRCSSSARWPSTPRTRWPIPRQPARHRAGARRADPLASGRVTLLGDLSPRRRTPSVQAVRDRYLAANPTSAYYIDFGDFTFFRLAVDSIRYVGGYGRMSWVRRRRLRARRRPIRWPARPPPGSSPT